MKLKNTFVLGKMNKDLDERLLPKGEYPHAENIRVSNTDSSDIGAIENVYGNAALTDFNLTNAKTIGVYSDDSNQKLYWFTTSDEKDLVVEYNVVTSTTTVLLESTNPDGVLNFDSSFLITGIVKIINGDSDRDLLFWTDDLNPPRVINIERSKTYGVDGFVEDDISVIKKPPRYAPDATLTFTSSTLENNIEDKFLSFAYRYKYLDGEYSALSSFTNYNFSPNEFALDYQTMENLGMVNSFNAVRLDFNTGSKRVTDVELVFKESVSNIIYIVETFKKSEEAWLDDESRSYVFSNSKIYSVLPEAELFRTFDNVPRAAKAMEDIGNRIVYGNYLEQYDLKNIYGNDINVDYSLSLITKSLDGERLNTTFSTSAVDSDLMTFDIGSNDLKKDTRLTFDLFMTETSGSDGNYEHAFDFILSQDYASAAELAVDVDFISFVEDIMTNNLLNNGVYTVPANSVQDTVVPFTIVASTPLTITIQAPIVNYEVDDTPLDPLDNPLNTHIETYIWSYNQQSAVYYKEIAIDSSLKTNRSYEVGIIYMDEYNRATTVLTDPDNTLYIPQIFSTSQNKISVNINHLPPVWADRYKLVIKQNKGKYETIYTNIFYEDGLFRWIKLEGNNVSKVQEGDTLIVKSDLGGVIEEIIEVKVIEVSNKDADFIENNVDDLGQPIVEEAGRYMKIKPLGVDINYNAQTFNFYAGSQHLRYPVPQSMLPYFGTYAGAVFTPFELKAGSKVTIFIKFEARGKIAYVGEYNRSFLVQADYSSIQAWFNAEVETLGAFGDTYTRDYGFTPNGDSFFVHAHRDGTATRNITTNMRWDILSVNGNLIFETKAEDINSDIFYETEQTFDIVDNLHTANTQNQTSSLPAIIELDAFNCYVQGNGAESYQYKDAFNGKYLAIDLRPSSTSIEEYREVRRYGDLTYSGVYNENTNLNGLNNFNLATANFKEDIHKKYGHIQKLYARDTDLVVFQEDKVSRVLYGKDLLMNADGTSNVSSTESVLGQQIAYGGEYGISRNPESFAFDAYNLYFTDAKRGSVLRLGNNGITEISSLGLRSWYKDVFRDSIDTKKTAAFDPYHDQYVLHPSDEFLSKPEVISCEATLVRGGFTGELGVSMDFGVQIGDAGFSYSSNGVPVRYVLEWNGNTYDTGYVGDPSYDAELIGLGLPATVGLGTGSLIFPKTLSSPNQATIKIFAPICDTDFTLAGNCVVGDNLHIVSVIINDEGDAGKEITNKYKWSNPSFVSPFKNYNSIFELDGVTLFEDVVGEEGVGFTPITGSEITMESFKGFGQSGDFITDECDRMGYLISDTPYTELDITTILSSAIFPTNTEVISGTGEVTNSIEFTYNRPLSETYLYLIWDYVNRKPVAVDDYTDTPKGSTLNYPVLVNDSDPQGLPLTVTIVSPPVNGTATVEPDGSITYVHNNTDTTQDLVSYVVSNGECTSNVATLFIDIAVSCQDSFAHNGNQGSFSFNISFGANTGMAGIAYDSYQIPDQFDIYWDGNLVATTGIPVSGSGTLLFNKATANPTVATVVVTAPNSGTAWSMSGVCPI